MDIISDMSFVFLGSHLKRLSERMLAESSLLASEVGADVPPGLYPVLALLKKVPDMSIGELAREIGISQPAMTKNINKLVDEGLVSTRTDDSDKRKSVALLTVKGMGVVERGEQIVWPLLDKVVRELTEDLTGSFIDQITELEKRMAEESLPSRASRLSMLELQPAKESDLSDVVSLLNRAYRSMGSEGGWTTEVGILFGARISEETLREEVASKPNATLLLWKKQDKVKGCVWLEPETDGVWYLGSLAIEPQMQDAQYGRRLMQAAEHYCLARGAKKIQMTVLEVRESLVRWYERRGYNKTGKTEPFPLNDTRFGIPAHSDLKFIFMEKTL